MQNKSNVHTYEHSGRNGLVGVLRITQGICFYIVLQLILDDFFFFFYFERCPEIILKEKFSFCCCSVLPLRLTLCNPVVQHARIPCPSLSPSVCASSCPLSGQCHPTILSSANPLSSCPQPPNISVFSNESALCIRWPNYWNFISVLPVSIQG